MTEPFGVDNKLRLNESLSQTKPIYIVPEDPLIEEVLIPAFQSSLTVDCMAGFFSSAILASLAPGLATFINNPIGRTIRLLISPVLSEEDREAIELGTTTEDELLETFFTKFSITEDYIQRHTLRCLSWLLRLEKIEIKVAFMRAATFHPKVWIFGDEDGTVAVHGSSNITFAGVTRNLEQVAISKSWTDNDSAFVVSRLDEQFGQLWSNRQSSCLVLPIPTALREDLINSYAAGPMPLETDYLDLYEKANSLVSDIDDFPSTWRQKLQFKIPSWLNYQSGPFAHQGQAVDAWSNSDHRGILEMATGSGKTITAMICVHRLSLQCNPLLVVVSAPYLPLIEQWCKEIEIFGISPVNLSRSNNAGERAGELGRMRRSLELGHSRIEIAVVSHDTLCSSSFHNQMMRFNGARMLIADEVHNLGREQFVSNQPEYYEMRLGLSATPIRQYDPDGTDEILNFFGDIVYRYSMSEAIGHCLVEYDYYLHPVDLNNQEMDDWYELTQEIKKNGWRRFDNESDDYLMKLYRDRRRLLENASGKIAELESLMRRENLTKLRHTLIYCSDKDPEQLNSINALMRRMGVMFHQLTQIESRDRVKTSNILDSFASGGIQVLTAKRVLDEGVNVPQICRAYILASTTVERQWIQRRGRLLRTCNEIGKSHAEIHDFVTMPPPAEREDIEAKSLIESELTRVREFARLARNAGKHDGPLGLIDDLVHTAFK